MSHTNMKKLIFATAAFLLFAVSCNKDYDVPIPTIVNSTLKGTMPLEPASKILMEGIYMVNSTSGMFGDSIVLKWNRKSLSLACFNGNYFVMAAGSLDSNILLEGYWRNANSDGTGLCTMSISKTEGGSEISNEQNPQKIVLRGMIGHGESLPDQSLTLTYLRSFSEKVKNSKFNILAHRGGGRTSDRLPASENSIEMLNFTERLGSTGIELDVRLTRDKVAFLYHDPDVNIRLTQKGPLSGEISAYSWLELTSHLRLIHGEKIPSLEAALTFVVDSTKLNFVYLDMKEETEAMSVVIPIQQKMLQRARDKGQTITILVGIPTTNVLNDLMSFPGYQTIPSLCELTVDEVRTANSIVWAPRWTMGTQNELVEQMHAEGRMAICWTIDNPGWIKDYLNNGQFDGLLTNFPSVVTYYHYIQK